MEVAAPLPDQDYNDRLNRIKRERTVERIDAEEIARLRERSHEHGNKLQEHDGHFFALEASARGSDEKLDAIKTQIAELRADMKEDLNEIKLETKATNGRVSKHDLEIASARGGMKVMALGLPVVTGLLLYVLVELLSLGS